MFSEFCSISALSCSFEFLVVVGGWWWWVGGGSQRLLCHKPTTVIVVFLLGLWLLLGCDKKSHTTSFRHRSCVVLIVLNMSLVRSLTNISNVSNSSRYVCQKLYFLAIWNSCSRFITFYFTELWQSHTARIKIKIVLQCVRQ